MPTGVHHCTRLEHVQHMRSRGFRRDPEDLIAGDGRYQGPWVMTHGDPRYTPNTLFWTPSGGVQTGYDS